MLNQTKKASSSMRHAAIVVYVLLGCFTFLWLVAPLTAAPRLVETITVNTTTDELNSGNTLCSLREAIEVVNAGSSMTYTECTLAGTADGTYIINLSAGTYSLTLIGAGEDDNQTGDLDIEASVSIVGAGAGSTFVQAGTAPDNGIDRVFHVESGAAVRLEGLTVQYGTATTTGATDGGGGILNESSLEVSDAIMTSNSVTGTAASGGGILNTGTLSMTNSTVSNNSSQRAGGGIETTAGATVKLTDVDLLNNTTGIAGAANPGNGGGLHMTGAGTVSVTSGNVSGNFAASEGGGLWNGSGTMTIEGTMISNNAAAGNGADQGGGGVFNAGGTMTVTNATIDNNLASGATALSLDGGQEVPAVTTSAMGDAIFQYDAVAGTFQLDLFVTGLELTDVSAQPELTAAHIHQAAAGANGGVIVNLLTLGSSFEEVPRGLRLLLEDQAFPPAEAANLLAGNTYINVHSTANGGGEIRGQITFPAPMGSGGGILNDQGTLTVDNSTITNNVASRAGGGIESNVGTNSLTNMTLNNNVAGPEDVATPGNGGGLHITGAGDANITGGEVMSNRAAAEGGGLWNGAGTMTVDGTTISNNTASGDPADQGGGGLFNAGGTLNVTNAMISNNVADGASGSGGGILNDNGGTLNVSSSTISDNTSNRAGGGIETTTTGATVNLTDVDLLDNDTGSSPGNGGGLHMTGAGLVSVSGGDVMSNTATAEGGGLWNGSGTMTVTNSIISNNEATGNDTAQGGGGLFNAGGTLTVMSATIESNIATGTVMTDTDEAGSGGGILNDGGTLIVSDSTIRGNSSVRAGGGIEDNARTMTTTVSLDNVDLLSNSTGSTPGNGGGLHVSGGLANVLIADSLVMSNTAAAEGGGLWNGSSVMAVGNSTISNNTASGNDPNQGGGGLFNAGGALTVIESTITNNVADGTAGSGGGILNDAGGILNVFESTINGNTSNRAGGGIETTTEGATVILLNTDLLDNDTGNNPGNGGGLHMTGAGLVSVSGGDVMSNTAAAEGGGLWNGSGTMSVDGTIISNNTASGNDADQGGGGLFNAGGTLTVMNATINNNVADGTAGSGGGILNDAGSLTVSGTTISGNSSVRAGGGIESNAGTTSLSLVILDGNETGDNPGNGGGLHITGAGTATVIDSTVQNNIATEGGGLWNSAAGRLFVDGSTLNDNTADGIANGQDGGGGIYNDGILTVVNSTLSSNDAPTGGGISNVGTSANAQVINSTLYENSEGGIDNNGGALELNQSIVGHNTATGNDCTGTITAMNANLDSDGTCGASITASPQLAALANNGGPTLTHALLPSSLALNAGDNAVCTVSPVNGVDQRDMVRPQGNNCDLGGYETDGVPTAVVLNGMAANTTPLLPLLAMGIIGLALGLIWGQRRTRKLRLIQ